MPKLHGREPPASGPRGAAIAVTGRSCRPTSPRLTAGHVGTITAVISTTSVSLRDLFTCAVLGPDGLLWVATGDRSRS